MSEQNHGMKLEDGNLQCDIMPLGAVGESQPDLVPDGNGEPYLPAYEPQSFGGTETMSCVTFGFGSHFESQRILLGLPELNFADRLPAILSGTDENGNTVSRVYRAYADHFSCLEAEFPPPKVPFTFAEYHDRSKVTEAVLEKAKVQASVHSLGMRVWVEPTPEGFRKALKKVGTLICWSRTHVFLTYRCDDRIRIFDTYPYGGGTGKRDLPLDAFGKDDGVLGATYVPLIVKPDPISMIFTEKTKYRLIEGIGGFFHFRNGVLVRDTEAKLDAEWQALCGVRITEEDAALMPSYFRQKVWNGAGDYFLGGRTANVTLKDIGYLPDGTPGPEAVALFNTKGERVTLGNPV